MHKQCRYEVDLDENCHFRSQIQCVVGTIAEVVEGGTVAIAIVVPIILLIITVCVCAILLIVCRRRRQKNLQKKNRTATDREIQRMMRFHTKNYLVHYTFSRASAMLKHVLARCWTSVCLSVRLPVTRWYCIKTAERIVMIFSPHDSPFILYR